jgi:hypothetical protein
MNSDCQAAVCVVKVEMILSAMSEDLKSVRVTPPTAHGTDGFPRESQVLLISTIAITNYIIYLTT